MKARKALKNQNKKNRVGPPGVQFTGG